MDCIQRHLCLIIWLTLSEGKKWITHNVQTIFDRPNRKYFPVSTIPLVGLHTIDVFLQQALTMAAVKDQEELRQNNTIIEEPHQRITPWLNRSGWLEMLAGQNMTELYPLTSARTDEEENFKCVRTNIESLIKECLNGVKVLDKRGWNRLRFWLNSTNISSVSQKPFQIHYDESTIKRYAEYWSRFILFTLRAFELQNSENGVQYTSKQLKVLQELKALTARESPSDTKIKRKVLKLSRLFIEHEDYKTTFPCALKYFCSVMGWDYATERWRQPGTYTPFLAGIQFCIRMLTCEFALPSSRRDEYCQTNRESDARTPL